MKKIKFDYHRVNARKDLVHFVEENLDPNVISKMGQDPQGWIDELSMVSFLLTKQSLIAGIGLDLPPTDDPEFRNLRNNAYFYRGNQRRLKGLWIRKETEEGKEDDRFNWTHYVLGGSSQLSVNKAFSDIPLEAFLPENFDRDEFRVFRNAEDRNPGKRPVYRFPVQTGGKQIFLYTKAADIHIGRYYEHARPKYRLTTLCSFRKTESKKEMENTLLLASLGVHTPPVIGFYEGAVEEFLYLQEVVGKNPQDFLGTHRKTLIQQDARMLAAMCLAGLRKDGFNDFDDKVFDGRRLWLIDVDECRDLYLPGEPDYREMVVNPNDTKALEEFRNRQREMFSIMLKDNLYRYRDSLTPTRDDKVSYIQAFYNRLGWEQPDDKSIRRLLHFPNGYTPFDSWISMMSEQD